MSLDLQLIETIKANFARRSSAHLQNVIQSNDPERWSPEAVAAAKEVLRERSAGLATEPLVPEEEPPPPPFQLDTSKLGLWGMLALAGLGAGVVVLPVSLVNRSYFFADPTSPPEPDFPLPFGPKMAWLALDCTETEAVAGALGLREFRAATWAEGIDAANQASIFISPPLADWTLVASTALIVRRRVDAAVKPLLEGLSRQFGDAQYFCSHSDDQLHIWARARQGRLVRGYGWDGKKRLTLWDEGKQTKEERDLGFEFLNPDSICASPRSGSKAQQVSDEACVMQLASLWSIDPSSLDEYFREPAMGLIGNVAHEVRRDAIQ